MDEEVEITGSCGAMGFECSALEDLGKDISEKYLYLINEIWYMKKGMESISELREKYEVKLASMLNDIDNAVRELMDLNERRYSDVRYMLFKRLGELEEEE